MDRFGNVTGIKTIKVVGSDGKEKSIGGAGIGVPTSRTITINGVTQDLSANRTWNVAVNGYNPQGW